MVVFGGKTLARLCLLVLGAVFALMAAAARAQSTTDYRYIPSGPNLFRLQGGAGLSVATLNPKDGGVGPWRALPSLPIDSAASEGLVGLRCSSAKPNLCFLAVTVGGRERVWWRATDLITGTRLPDWSALKARNLVIEDFDDKRGLVLLTARPMVGADPDDLPTGLYLWRAGQRLDQAKRLSDRPALGLARHASLLVDAEGAIRVFFVEASTPMAWTLVDQDGRRQATAPAPGHLAFRSGRTLYAVTDQPSADGRAPAGSLLAVTPPAAPNGEWDLRLAYAPPPGSRLVLDDDAQRPFAQGRVAGMTWSGGLLAIEETDRGRGLVELCRRDDETLQARPLDATLAPSRGGRMMLDGGWTQAAALLVTRRRTDGLTDLGLVAGAVPAGGRPIGAPCGHRTLTWTDLPERPGAVAALGPDAALEDRTLTMPGGRQLTYAVIGGSEGKTLVRVYGAFGVSNPRLAQGAFEARWLASGNRIAIVETISTRGGDYKAAAAADVVAIVEDIIARGEARRGDVLVSGTSAGAFLAARTALSRPDLFKAAILLSGAYDLQLWAESGVGNLAEFGPPEGGFPRWFAATPARDGGEVRFLLVHAADDDRLSPAGARRFAAYLKTLGYKGELVLTQRGGHAVGQSSEVADSVAGFLAR